MPKITFIVKNKKNKGIVLNDKELLSLYFYGIEIVNKQGTSINPAFLEWYIRAAQNEIENFLQIRLVKQIVEERSDYYMNEFRGTGFVRTKLPIKRALSMKGKLGDQQVVSYPEHWLVFNRVNDNSTSRQFLVTPNSNVSETTLSEAVYGTNIIASLGLVNRDQVASYWEIKYITGFDILNPPFDIMNLVGKMASIGLFDIMGDIALGTAALASYSLSIDGLSQSISTTNSATSAAYNARVLAYQKEIKDTLEKLKGVYKGITFSAI